MNGARVIAPIVEGHGEMAAVRRLVERIAVELLGTWVEVAQPFRLDSSRMRKPDELRKAIRFQAARAHRLRELEGVVSQSSDPAAVRAAGTEIARLRASVHREVAG